MQPLTLALGFLLWGFAILTWGCAEGPVTGPSAIPTGPAPVITPAAQRGTFSLALEHAQRGVHVAPGDVWHGTIVVTPAGVSPPQPTRFTVECPAATLSLPGSFGHVPFTCRMPLGEHVVRVVADDVTATINVTVAYPPPATAYPYVWAVMFDERRGTDLTFDVPAVGDARRYHWAFGDGNVDSTLTTFTRHRYAPGARQREVTVRAVAEDGRTLATGRLVGLW